MDEVHLDRGTIELLAVVRGLPSETLTVRRAIESVRPEVIGLSIGPEELRTLRSYDGGPLAPENLGGDLRRRPLRMGTADQAAPVFLRRDQGGRRAQRASRGDRHGRGHVHGQLRRLRVGLR